MCLTYVSGDMCMEEKIVAFLISKGRDHITNLIKNRKWQQLFIETGESLFKNGDVEDAFMRDLQTVFSAENMNQIASELKDSSGYEFISELQRSLRKLMKQYEIPDNEAETYIHHFTQRIICFIRDADHEKGMELTLGELSSRTESEYQEIAARLEKMETILQCLNQKKNTIQSLNNIETRIIQTSKASKEKKRIDLDFFELDDEQFASDFEEMIHEESIYIVGSSRKETLYRILGEIKKKYYDRPVLIAESKEDWIQLAEQKTEKCIIIPDFYDESVMPIPNNTNIFIYHLDEPCYARNKLVLRRRTRSNLVHALVRYGYDYREAYRIVETTNGIYAAMKKRLFVSAERGARLPWVEQHSKPVMAALLCGSWTGMEGDRNAFEKMTGKSYDVCMEELLRYSHEENPFIVEIRHGGQVYYRLASPEDAWVELQRFLIQDLWDSYTSLLFEALAEKRMNWEEQLKHDLKKTRGEDPGQGPKWSDVIRNGLVKTLIMRTAFDTSPETQQEIDRIVFGILNGIETEVDWKRMADLFPMLCQASPERLLSRLEKEILEPTGMRELFTNHSAGFWNHDNQYVSVLWAVEQLIQQKQYVYRAVKWLLAVDDYGITYKIGNNPEEILSLVFCPWLNVTALRGQEKIRTARDAVRDYSSAWRIIAKELPGNKSARMVSLNSPDYRRIEEPENAMEKEYYDCVTAYLAICVDAAGKIPERWCEILNHLTYFETDKQRDMLDTIVEACQLMGVSGKTDLKEKLRDMIHRHRYFLNAPWHIEEETIALYEAALQKIRVEEAEYDYLYLLGSEADFSLLHPVPVDLDDFQRGKSINDGKREEEIRRAIKDFKNRRLSVERLIELGLEKERYSELGKVLAEFYCENEYDDSVFSLLMEQKGSSFQAYMYVRTLFYFGHVNLAEVIRKIQTESKDIKLLTNVSSIQPLGSTEKSFIFQADEEIKKAYWGEEYQHRIAKGADKAIYLEALRECLAYGNIQSYAELLHESMKALNAEQLYDNFMRISECRIDKALNDLTRYHLEEVLKYLQEQFLEDDRKNFGIARIEWYLGDAIAWTDKRCTQRIIKRSPELYAYLIGIIYKHSEDEKPKPEKQALISRIYSQFQDIHFCPAEENGKVDYEELKKWADKYRELLQKQGQEWLWAATMGELLTYSPKEGEGGLPCVSVCRFIDENYSEELGRAYCIEEKNKRGVYSPNAGRGERVLAEKYRKIADELNPKYPYTAGIYYELSRVYLRESEEERKEAENGF